MDQSQYGKNYVQLVCTKNTDSRRHFLIYTRAVSPFLDCTGFPSGKIDHGEEVLVSASRELQEETGLTDKNPKLVAIIHYLFKDKSDSVVRDEYMYICHFDNPNGELVDSEEGHVEWVSENELTKKLNKPFVPVENYIKIIDLINNFDGHISFLEKTISAENF